MMGLTKNTSPIYLIVYDTGVVSKTLGKVGSLMPSMYNSPSNKILRKIESMTVMSLLEGKSYGELSFKALSYTEATSPFFTVKNKVVIYLGWYEWWTFSKDISVVLTGQVEKVRFEYLVDGITATVTVTPTGSPKDALVGFEKVIQKPIFDGKEKTIEDAILSIAKYCGLNVRINIENTKIKDWMNDTGNKFKGKPWLYSFIMNQMDGSLKQTTPRDIVEALAKRFGQTWRIDANGTLYFGTHRPKLLDTNNCEKLYSFEKSVLNSMKDYFRFSDYDVNICTGISIEERETQSNAGNNTTTVDLEKKDILNTNTKIKDKDTVNTNDKVQIMEADGKMVLDDETITKEYNTAVKYKEKITEKTKKDTEALSNPTSYTTDSVDAKEDEASIDGKNEKGAVKALVCKITGAIGDGAFMAGGKYYFKGVPSHTGAYMAEEVRHEFKTGGYYIMDIVGTKPIDPVNQSVIIQKSEEEKVKNTIKKDAGTKEPLGEVDIFIDDTKKVIKDDDLKKQVNALK